VWTDKTTYGYAVVGSVVITEQISGASLTLCSTRPYLGVNNYINSNGVSVSEPCIEIRGQTHYVDCIVFFDISPDMLPEVEAEGIKDGEWFISSEGNLEDENHVRQIFDSASNFLWSNTDILNEDGSLYQATSAPISLDGMNVIEWDGDTTGLVSSSANTHYKVSDVVLSASGLVGSVIAFGGEAVVVPTEFITNGEGYASIDTYVLSCQNEGVSFDGNTFPEKGLYFINAFDVHLPFFAYPASGGGSGDDEDDDEDDTSPKEKHYCRINGTIYEVECGTAKMGGTFCEVKSGTVLIDGTVYDFALN
jgi:hypothetical protein